MTISLTKTYRTMARISKFGKSVLQIVILVIISFYLNSRPGPPAKEMPRFMQDLRHILLWTKIPGLDHEGQHTFMKRHCEELNCYLTTNKSLLGDIRLFDAIVFYVEDVAKSSANLPKVRSLTQKYIFAANDSADNYPVCDPVYDNFFNWTWTYRIDSAISFKYVTVYNLHQEELVSNVQWIPLVDMKPIPAVLKSSLQSKSKAAAIFLNKCTSVSKREEFVTKLQHELSYYNWTVDVYGGCGPFECGRRNMKACFYRLRTNYYFYLALEDSMAMDFITDTVLNAYDHNTVPIVYGGASYASFLPPNSFLDATGISIRKLARVMHQIINNKEWYYDFFRWKNHYHIRQSVPMNVCGLCSALNNVAWIQMNVTYTNFRKWWHPHYENRCGIKKKFGIF